MRVIYICPESALRYLCVHIFFLLALPPVCHASVCRVQKTHLMDRNGPNAKKKKKIWRSNCSTQAMCRMHELLFALWVASYLRHFVCSSDFFLPLPVLFMSDGYIKAECEMLGMLTTRPIIYAKCVCVCVSERVEVLPPHTTTYAPELHKVSSGTRRE